jgi:hypothetical protein
MPRFNHSFKMLILLCFICYFISLLSFNLSIHNIFIDKSIVSSSSITIAISVGLSGLFQGGASPLTYESLAEIMYPLPESLSASILVQFINLTSLVLFFIAPDRYKILNLIILIIIFICLILILFTRFTYKRRDADITRRATLVSSDFDFAGDSIEIHSFSNHLPMELGIDSVQMDPIHDIIDTDPIVH